MEIGNQLQCHKIGTNSKLIYSEKQLKDIKFILAILHLRK